MALKFSCPNCGRSIVTYYLKVGQTWRCPDCEVEFAVPRTAMVTAAEGTAAVPLAQPRPGLASGVPSGLRYDPSVIEQFARKLYDQAAAVVLGYTLLGVVLGTAAGAMLSGRATNPVLMLAGAAILGAIGFALGNEKAFWFRLQAQTALCQVQIEKNTRPGGQG